MRAIWLSRSRGSNYLDKTQTIHSANRFGQLLSSDDRRELNESFHFAFAGTSHWKSTAMKQPKNYRFAFLVVLMVFSLANCGTLDESSPSSSSTSSFGQPLRAVNGMWNVSIMEGDRPVSVCRTASPFVEETRFINEQEQIVVKSRARHGPATVQLFDTRNGAEQGRIMAYEIREGQPAWAAGLGE